MSKLSHTNHSGKAFANNGTSQTAYLTICDLSAHRPSTHCDGFGNRVVRAISAICDGPICTSGEGI